MSFLHIKEVIVAFGLCTTKMWILRGSFITNKRLSTFCYNFFNVTSFALNVVFATYYCLLHSGSATCAFLCMSFAEVFLSLLWGFYWSVRLFSCLPVRTSWKNRRQIATLGREQNTKA